MRQISSVAYGLAVVTVLAIACNTEPYAQGRRLYEVHCQNCHMEDGQGLENVIPPLAQADYLLDHQELIPCIILRGQEGEITVNGVVYDQYMPGKDYNAVQLTNLVNYINNAWGNNYGVVRLDSIQIAVDSCR